MPPSTLNESGLGRLGIETPIAHIDRALKQLWESDEAKTRASLINLAIYTEDSAFLAADNDVLDHVAAEHACRALLILALPDARPPRARAWIQALCRPYQGRQAVCSEQISFVLEGGDAAQVQNIVFAQLDSDLPLVVWWQADLTKNFGERFYSRIDTLIIDSARWNDPTRQFDALLEAKNAETADFDVRDLAWTRSHFMRTALANCFQDASVLQNLSRLQKLAITHLKGQRMTALLLAAWINKRLGATLQLEFIEKDTGPALQCLVLEGEGVRGEVRRDSDSSFVHVCASCGRHEHKDLLPADADNDAELVNEQLSRRGGNTLYSGMLPLIRAMLG
ncbi:MAG: glucose-6-phosphate dehydrogenase assembly protein OpcA [Verrucomicrobiaceae bacterium]|nr:glucose-6-phosphate dehydrogenase assembly protein OpcA [Verrucomicrobiaceae bacterium]